MIYCDFILDNGQMVRCELPQKYEDDFRETVNNELKLGGTISSIRWDGCAFTFHGNQIKKLNMARVVGITE